MARNRLYAVEEGRLTLVAPSGGFTSGVAKAVDGIIVVPDVTCLAAATATVFFLGVWTLAKKTGVAWTVGQRLYWDNGNAWFSTVGADGPFAGIAQAAAASGDATGAVLLTGPVGQLEGAQPAIADLDLTTLTDTPATADALRDNITATWEPQIEAKINAILLAIRTAGITL